MGSKFLNIILRRIYYFIYVTDYFLLISLLGPLSDRTGVPLDKSLGLL